MVRCFRAGGCVVKPSRSASLCCRSDSAWPLKSRPWTLCPIHSAKITNGSASTAAACDLLERSAIAPIAAKRTKPTTARAASSAAASASPAAAARVAEATPDHRMEGPVRRRSQSRSLRRGFSSGAPTGGSRITPRIRARLPATNPSKPATPATQRATCHNGSSTRSANRSALNDTAITMATRIAAGVPKTHPPWSRSLSKTLSMPRQVSGGGSERSCHERSDSVSQDLSDERHPARIALALPRLIDVREQVFAQPDGHHAGLALDRRPSAARPAALADWSGCLASSGCCASLRDEGSSPAHP